MTFFNFLQADVFQLNIYICKTSAVSTTDWMVEAQRFATCLRDTSDTLWVRPFEWLKRHLFCNLCNTSDTFVRWACLLYTCISFIYRTYYTWNVNSKLLRLFPDIWNTTSSNQQCKNWMNVCRKSGVCGAGLNRNTWYTEGWSQHSCHVPVQSSLTGHLYPRGYRYYTVLLIVVRWTMPARGRYSGRKKNENENNPRTNTWTHTPATHHGNQPINPPTTLYKMLKIVSCEYDRLLNGWNSTLQAAWYIRHVRIIYQVWLLILSFTQNIVRACAMFYPYEGYRSLTHLDADPGSTGRFSIIILCTDTI